MDSNELVIAVIVMLAGIIVLRSKVANSAPLAVPEGQVPAQTMPTRAYVIPHGH